jgi:hypothetical protein
VSPCDEPLESLGGGHSDRNFDSGYAPDVVQNKSPSACPFEDAAAILIVDSSLYAFRHQAFILTEAKGIVSVASQGNDNSYSRYNPRIGDILEMRHYSARGHI